MNFSTRLQNLTHAEIIELGSKFESDLIERLAAKYKSEKENEIQRLREVHDAAIEALEQKRIDERVLFKQKASESKKAAENFLTVEKARWNSECFKLIAAAKEKTINESEIEFSKRLAEHERQLRTEFSSKLDEIDQFHEKKISALKVEHDADTENLRKDLYGKIHEIRCERNKIQFMFEEREDYNKDFIADMKESMMQKIVEMSHEMEEKNRENIRQIKTQITNLTKTIQEKDQAIEELTAQVENEKHLFKKLKLAYKHYILMQRPELTDGQIDFMIDA